MRSAVGRMLAIALAAAGAAVTLAATPPPAVANDGCLWWGTSYSAATVVVTNGFGYTCHIDSATGDSFWVYSGPNPPSDATPVPGSVDVDITPATLFDPGAEVGWGGDLFTPSAGGWNDLGDVSNFGLGGDDGGGGVLPLKP